jgi:hypothetical protein
LCPLALAHSIISRVFDPGHRAAGHRAGLGEQLVDARAHALGVDAQIGAGIAGEDRPDELGLLLEVEPAQLVAFEDGEGRTLVQRGRATSGLKSVHSTKLPQPQAIRSLNLNADRLSSTNSHM